MSLNQEQITQLAVKLIELQCNSSDLLPARSEADGFIKLALHVIFPQIDGCNVVCTMPIQRRRIAEASRALTQVMEPMESLLPDQPDHITDWFFDSQLADIAGKLWDDARAMCAGDPAARSVEEVIATYPGIRAVAVHRMAHALHVAGVPVLPRLMTEIAHEQTGIDIHPGAHIGESFCIDHGTGIVIGETAVLGDNIKLYQGVTLGALSVAKDMASSKRHPTIEDNVVIYANATILGGDTVIGHHSVIGGNVFISDSVAPYSTVYHRPQVSLRNKLDKIEAFNFVI